MKQHRLKWIPIWIGSRMSLIRRRTNECTWDYVKDETKKADWVFNVTWKEPQYELAQPFDKTVTLTKIEENVCLMALTCTPFSYNCFRERLQDEKCGVTFALPFILWQKIYSMKESKSCGELLLRQFANILCCLVAFLGLVVAGFITYLYFSRKRWV